MMNKSDIDILESILRRQGDLLDILLKDRTTGRNIIWATDSYVTTGKRDDPFLPTKQIKPELVTGKYSKLIQPRAVKSKEEQKRRTKDKAEVFTPLHIVDEMNKMIDWAGNNKVVSAENWQNYVCELKLEITCGEAPFIASRYNPTSSSGKLIVLKNRVGFLDRKLRAVSEFCGTKEEWFYWVKEAYKASYGYEWQGDNILIARENLLYTFYDYYQARFEADKLPPMEWRTEIATIISWNIWQMDGLKYTVPMSGGSDTPQEVIDKNQTALRLDFGRAPKKAVLANNIKYAVIKDWSRGKNGVKIRFIDLLHQKDKTIIIKLTEARSE